MTTANKVLHLTAIPLRSSPEGDPGVKCICYLQQHIKFL